MAWALVTDGVNDYLDFNFTSTADELWFSARIKIAAGDASSDKKIIAFNPSGVGFYGFGVQSGRLRIYARGNNGQYSAVTSSQSIKHSSRHIIDISVSANRQHHIGSKM